MTPVFKVLQLASRCNEAWGEARVLLQSLGQRGRSAEDVHLGHVSGWQDEGGGFSDMNLIARKLGNGWHLDHGILASLLRIWAPPSLPLDGCHTTVADFGAGSGHYCSFLNATGEFCCEAFDGSAGAARLSEVSHARLDAPLDLGRTLGASGGSSL